MEYLMSVVPIGHYSGVLLNLGSRHCVLSPQAMMKVTKELRMKELSGKDRVAYLKAELDEAKERKKVGMAEREQIRKGKYPYQESIWLVSFVRGCLFSGGIISKTPLHCVIVAMSLGAQILTLW